MTASPRLALVLLSVVAFGGCGDDGASTQTIAPVQEAIDQIVDDYPTLHGVVVHVIASDQGIDQSIASGDNLDGPINPDATFRLASVTKTFTAATVLRLVEQGKVELDGPLSQCVDPELAAAVEADGYDLDAITVRQALGHTAGFYDFGEDQGYFEAVFADPTHRWSRLEQLQWAVDHGDPLGSPGESFSYDNTGYVVLGSLIECASGVPLADAYRELLRFDELGLDATYVESVEAVAPGAGPRAHQFFGDVDTFAFDPSMNLYGDGGIVSSTADVAHFSRALLEGEVFDEPATLEAMLQPPANAPDTTGLGIFREDLFDTTCWSHQGLWGTAFFTCPDVDLTISASVQQGELEDVDLNPILFAAFELIGR